MSELRFGEVGFEKAGHVERFVQWSMSRAGLGGIGFRVVERGLARIWG